MTCNKRNVVGQLLVCVGVLLSSFSNAQLASFWTINAYAGIGRITEMMVDQKFSGDGGAATSSELTSPYGMWVTTANEFLLADSDNGRVRKIDGGNIITTFMETAIAAAGVSLPWGMCGDSVGNLYLAGYGGPSFKKIDTVGIISNFAGTGNFGIPADGEPATSSSFSSFYNCFADTNGDVYLGESGNRLHKVTVSDGKVHDYAGSGQTARAFMGVSSGQITSIAISMPESVVIDTNAHLYFGEFFGVIRKTVMGSGILTTFGGISEYNGFNDFDGDNGPVTSAGFKSIYSITFDTLGNLFIGSSAPYIRGVDSVSNIVRTIAGDRYGGYSGDGGYGRDAKLTDSYIVLARGTDVYFSDMGVQTVRVLSPCPTCSDSPSASPSTEPTPAPSAVPSVTPSAVPSATPSEVPTATPSAIPSVVPSATPSEVPTATPSVTPSVVPTASPSDASTATPSATPSALPSVTPSEVPTVTPSVTPSALPSVTPSALPSVTPSEVPTATPSATPSALPSVTPSEVPTATPSVTPSAVPSVEPTASPSVSPSAQPSVEPSLEPTEVPSQVPSEVPSTEPSSVPTMQPSEVPSVEPSVVPSQEPSVKPSRTPSHTPTVRPTRQPTAKPSQKPTPAPTVAFSGVVVSAGVNVSPVHIDNSTSAGGIRRLERAGSMLLREESDNALIIAAAQVLGVTEADVTIESEQIVSNVDNIATVLVKFKILVTKGAFSSYEAAYEAFEVTLNDAIDSDVFKTKIVTVAEDIGAYEMYQITAMNLDSINNEGAVNTVPSDKDGDDLATGYFAGVVIGVIVAFLALFALVYLCISASASGGHTGASQSQPSQQAEASKV